MNKIALAFLCVFFINLNVVFISAFEAVVHVPERYADVYTGERFYFETNVNYTEHEKGVNLRLTYTIMKDGTEFARSKVLKTVNQRISFIDFIMIPEGIEEGAYTLNLNVQDRADLSINVSTDFYIKANKTMQIQKYFLIIIAVLFIFIVFLSWEIYILRKTK